MLRSTLLTILGCICFTNSPLQAEEKVLFEDRFEGELSPEWRLVGLTEEDYRIKDGGLELRVQPGKRTRETGMLQVILPFTTAQTVIASVDVTPLDRFTELGECAGIHLTDADSREFGAMKMNVNGHLVFSPGQVEFIGEDGDEGDPQQYALKFWPANESYGALRIIIRGDYAHFQVGPSNKGKYLNFFHSAVRNNEPQRGFCLFAAGGPDDKEHWVRFDNFRVTR